MKKILFTSLLLLAANKGVFAGNPVLFEEENSRDMELETQNVRISLKNYSI